MSSDRHHKSLQGVLRYAIENSKCEDELQAPKGDEMEAERKKFLENVLRSMQVDVVEELEKGIRCLESEETTAEEKVEALNLVRDYTDNLDFANNFITIGGSKVLLACLKSDYSKLKICAAYVIAELSQNNPFCQKHFLDRDVLQLLILYLKEDADVASSAMHAISSLVRSFEEGCAKFIEMDGLECIMQCLQSSHNNVFLKSCFLLRALSTEYPAVRDEFVKLGAVSKLASYIDPVIGFDLKIEILLSALNVLTQSKEGRLHLQKTNITSTIQELIETNVGKAECEEILKDSAALLACLQNN